VLPFTFLRSVLPSSASITGTPGEIASQADLIRPRHCVCGHGLCTCFPEGKARGASGRRRGLWLFGWYGRDSGRDANDATPACMGILRSRALSICVRHHTLADIFAKCREIRRFAAPSSSPTTELARGKQRLVGCRTNPLYPGRRHAIPLPCARRSATRMDAPSYRACSCCFEIDCCGQ